MSTSVSTGWGSRLLESIKGVLIGIVLIIGSIIVLFWNEGRAVRTARSLDEGAKVVVSVKADAVDPANEGKLVHMTGEVTTDERLADDTFGVGADALVLRRKVETYQRTLKSETKKKIGGGEVTTYTCDQMDWSATHVDVSKCEDVPQNPQPRWNAADVASKRAKLGAFDAPVDLLLQLGAGDLLQVDAAALKSAAPDVALHAIVHDGKVYVGLDPSKPAVGDARVSFTAVKPTQASVIAAQRDHALAPYQTKASDALFTMTAGAHSADAMFKAAQAANVTMTWILRGLGWLFMLIGFYLVFNPLVVLADVLPIFGTLLSAGTFVFALLASSMISTFTCAIAWVFYRPLIGVALFGAGVACVVTLTLVGRARRRR